MLRGSEDAARPETERRSSPAQRPPHDLAPAPERSSGSRLLRPSLVCGDVVLVVLAGWLVFTKHGKIGLVEAALCLAAVTLGAWLACLALWR